MRTRVSVAAIVAGVACGTGAAYAAGGPGAVYNDYAADGVLSCNHSRADLEAVLRSGSLNQYGDPLTMARLKLAVRKQLAGGCRHRSRSGKNGSAGAGTPSGGGTGSSGSAQKPRSSNRSSKHQPFSPPHTSPGGAASAGGDNASFIAGRGLIVGLLVAALAFGGWLTKHALAARD